jgi:ribosomal protein L6P/L9E
MLSLNSYFIKPIFVDYLESNKSYFLVKGTEIAFSFPKFVTSRSSVSYFGSKIRKIKESLKTSFQILYARGIGFKVYYYKHDHTLYLALGYNHLCCYCLSQKMFVKVRKQYMLIYSKLDFDIMFPAREIKGLRLPDPYRGKGIRVRGEELELKKGKQR